MSSQRQEQIVRAALQILDETELDAVSLRAVAKRLDVRLNTVSWHIGTKTRLHELMADAVLADVSLEGLPTAWRERLHELSARYRAALLTHHDGAALVAGTYPTGRNTLRVGEEFIASLLEAGCDERDAAWACWTTIYFTLGLVQEEQRAPEDTESSLRHVVTSEDYPALNRTMKHVADGNFDERHRFGIDLIFSSLPVRKGS